MFQVYITGVFMNFFDLLLPKRRKQKEVDLFFLHSLAAHSGEYKDVLAAAFEKIKKLSHTNSLRGGKELGVRFSGVGLGSFNVPCLENLRQKSRF